MEGWTIFGLCCPQKTFHKNYWAKNLKPWSDPWWGAWGWKTSHQWNVGSSHKSGVPSALGQPCQCRGTRCQCWIPVACSWNPEWWVGQIFWHLFHALFLAAGPEQSFCNASTRMIQLTKLKVGQTNLQKCFCDTKTCRVEPILTLVSWALILHLLSTM